MDRSLSHDRYLAALKRLRKLIADGRPLTHEDSTEIGFKYTTCSWGLCADDLESWPDGVDHVRVIEAPRGPRGEYQPVVHRKSLASEDFCPMDRGTDPNWRDPAKAGGRVFLGAEFGCFYRCRIFSPAGYTREDNQPIAATRQGALELYDVRIEAVRRRGPK